MDDTGRLSSVTCSPSGLCFRQVFKYHHFIFVSFTPYFIKLIHRKLAATGSLAHKGPAMSHHKFKLVPPRLSPLPARPVGWQILEYLVWQIPTTPSLLCVAPRT
jgi:hypothetical protein